LTSSTPAASDPNAQAPSDRLWLRSELMGTQVITRDTGRRLGVVGEVVVDIDRREVVALGLRDNPLTRFLPGLPRWMPLERIRQVGDVILVDSADSLVEGFDPERYSKVINCQVITESGAQLGRVLGFSFDVETGELTTLVIGAIGVPLLGEGVLSTWEMPVGEIVSSGSDRIIVYEGAEEKLKQLGTGLLEKLGIGGGGWEQEERQRFRAGAVPAENQLPAGLPTAVEQRRIEPATSSAFRPEQDYDYVELEDRREREPQRQRRYLDEEDPQSGRRMPEEGYREPDESRYRERFGSAGVPRYGEPGAERYSPAGGVRYGESAGEDNDGQVYGERSSGSDRWAGRNSDRSGERAGDLATDWAGDRAGDRSDRAYGAYGGRDSSVDSYGNRGGAGGSGRFAAPGGEHFGAERDGTFERDNGRNPGSERWGAGEPGPYGERGGDRQETRQPDPYGDARLQATSLEREPSRPEAPEPDRSPPWSAEDQEASRQPELQRRDSARSDRPIPRRPLDAAPPAPDSTRARQPIEVEAEVLDDPW
jgi:sporulation protein YlmC with PRC-barrel domain